VRDTELQQEVKVVNSGGDELPFTVALHSYFRVGDITQVRGTGCGCMGCFLAWDRARRLSLGRLPASTSRDSSCTQWR